MAGEGGLKLLGASMSPFSIRVRMALDMKGVSYEYLEQDLFHKGELLLRSNPVHKKVPVLIHAGRPICESLAIVQYVDEVWSSEERPSILPAGPYERATARFWAAYVDDELFPAWVGLMQATTAEERAARLGETLPMMARLEEAFAACSGGGAFFGGGSVRYLDLAVGCNLFWLDALREMFGVAVIDAGRTPLLAAWAARFGGTEAVRAVVPDADDTVEFAHMVRAYNAAATATATASKQSGGSEELRCSLAVE